MGKYKANEIYMTDVLNKYHKIKDIPIDDKIKLKYIMQDLRKSYQENSNVINYFADYPVEREIIRELIGC